MTVIIALLAYSGESPSLQISAQIFSLQCESANNSGHHQVCWRHGGRETLSRGPRGQLQGFLPPHYSHIIRSPLTISTSSIALVEPSVTAYYLHSLLTEFLHVTPLWHFLQEQVSTVWPLIKEIWRVVEQKDSWWKDKNIDVNQNKLVWLYEKGQLGYPDKYLLSPFLNSGKENLIENHLILFTGVTMILDGILVSEPFYVEHLYKWHCHLKAVEGFQKRNTEAIHLDCSLLYVVWTCL